MLGMQEMNADDMTRKLEDMLPVIRQVNEQFRDPVSLPSAPHLTPSLSSAPAHASLCTPPQSLPDMNCKLEDMFHLNDTNSLRDSTN